ncbi:MAG: restriction endonuclease subunit S [Chloroflexia bacterium]|nr:restriction endonuclease subunit S [Chloroflexia bacterium]
MCRFIDYRGKTPEKTASGLRLITAKNVKMGYLQENPMEFVAPESYDSWMTRGIPKMGDVLFTTEAPLANVAQLDTDEKVVFAQRIIVLQPAANNLDPTFLKYLLLSDMAQDRILERGTGATVQGIKASLLKTIPIEFPPLPEQQRIVAILDEAFAGLATAVANAEKNLQNARAIFESHLNEVFTTKGEGWVETTIGDAFNTATGTTPPKSNSAYYGDFMPFVKPPELCDAPLASASDNLSRAGSDVARTLPPRSILVSCIGNLGKVGLNTVAVAFNQQINAILPDESKAMPYLMFYQALSSSFKEQLEGFAGGTTVPIVNKSKFNSVGIVLPPLREQAAIVTCLDALAAETRSLAALYERKLAALGALKKSLLHQAFAGEL